MEAASTTRDIVFATEAVAGVKFGGREAERRPVASRLLRDVAESGDVVAAATDYEPQQDATGGIITLSFALRPPRGAPALENGRRLLALVTEALGSDRTRKARLPFLLSQFGGVSLRAPAVHEYLHNLQRRGESVERALGVGGGRGRPPEHTRRMHMVSLIDWFMDAQGICVRQAAEAVQRS